MNYHDVFKKLRPLLAPHGLKTAILERIRFEERAAARRVMYVTVPALVASFAGIAWGVSAAASALSHSSLLQYVSLAFSDPASVVTAWQSFSLSIVESLPIFALTVIVGALLLFVVSALVASQNVRRAFSFT